MAPAGFSGRRQFDVACGVLSRCVKAEAATSGGKMAAAAAAAPATMLLMPGADVTSDVREEQPEAATPPELQARRLTIMYGDRVLVFDDFPSYRVAELVLVAERPDVPGAGGTTADIPVARKASLQRFMEKRRDRLVARAPYAARPASSSSSQPPGRTRRRGILARSWCSRRKRARPDG